MSRAIFNDKLMTHQFHVLDVDWSMSFPPWVLSPSAGFSTATMPELRLTTETIKEGTDPFPNHVITGAEAGEIVLGKGVSAFNADFWRWTVGCLMGEGAFDGKVLEFLKKTATLQAPPIPGKRRNLMLIHMTGVSINGLAAAASEATGLEKVKAGLLSVAGIAAQSASNLVSATTGGLIETGITSVPGKVYMLFGCLPVGYKPGSDFDAAQGEVSIEELTISFHRFEEMSLSA